jgi:Zinc dependent phospholipase C
MPGSYAHITVVNIASEKRHLSRIKDFPREAIDAANLNVHFLELGSISPDYPYLDVTSGDSKKWADAMHYTHTGPAIHAGAELVRSLPAGKVKEKSLAWLMGYTAHVVTDMCVHPVVELKVGPYQGNETAHRRCEMHQDAYIYRLMGTGMPQTAAHLNATVVNCGDRADPKKLDDDIKKLWQELLKKVHPQAFHDEPPDMNKWHRGCYDILQQFLPTSSRFVGFARHACDKNGLLYPTPAEIETKEYIDSLRVPSAPGQEKRMHYDEIFDRAIDRVQKEWLGIARYALGLSDQVSLRNDEWDLDTGRNKLAGNKLVFWEVA